MKKISLIGLFPEEITKSLDLTQNFRGKQIYNWIYSGTESFDEMTNLSKALRASIGEKATLYSSSVKKTLKDPDGTIKLQIETEDGFFIETVLLTDKDGRKTACVSCQAGCPMKCAFCQTGQLGFARNLKAGEIIEQFLFLEKICGKLDNIVFMGMGEPLLNLEEIRKTLAILTDEKGRNLSKRRITLSTSGIIEGIYNLADKGPNIRLAVSLTTANEELRKTLMPVTFSNPLEKLKKAIEYYAAKSGNRVTIEAALMKDVNTDEKSANKLVNFAKGINVNINLIPWNPIKSLPFEEPTDNEVRHFYNELKRHNLNVTLRTKRGREIGGACGQLGKILNENKKKS